MRKQARRMPYGYLRECTSVLIDKGPMNSSHAGISASYSPATHDVVYPSAV